MRGCARNRLASNKEEVLWNRHSHSETSLSNVWNGRPLSMWTSLTSGKHLIVLPERSYGSSCKSTPSLVQCTTPSSETSVNDQNLSCIFAGRRTSDWFEVRSGCVMSGFTVFVIVIDWVMRKTLDKRRGPRWNLTAVLEDLDYANDIVLLATRNSDIREKTSRSVLAEMS